MSDFVKARQKMVDGQVRPSDVTDIRILEAMLRVPREVFIPPHLQALAYLDLDLDVGDAGSSKRFLIKPAVTAKMLQAAELKRTDKVLVVGCATGYTAALAAILAGQVTATEIDPAQAAATMDALARLGLSNVSVIQAAPADGYPHNAPYDVIILDGATEVAPERLYRQLGEDGRLVGVYAVTKPPRAMMVTYSHGDRGSRSLFDVTVPVLPGLERLPAFVF